MNPAPQPRQLFVVLPAYNEAAGLPRLLDRFLELFLSFKMPAEVIVINDGSTDATGDLARAKNIGRPLIVIDVAPNQGLGATMRRAFTEALARAGDDDLVVTMDADDTHKPDLIPKMVAAVDAGADIVVASRYCAGAQQYGLTPGRILLSKVASTIFRFAAPIPQLRDYTCGYRLYRAALLKKAQTVYGERLISRDSFACMAEILLKLRRFAPRVQEVPLELRYDRKHGKSKMPMMRTIVDTMKLLVDVKKLAARGESKMRLY